MQPSKGISVLLREWSNGDRKALDQLIPLVYEQLHSLAHRYLRRENSAGTLQTTALVNEAYLQLVNVHGVEWKDRAHFFAISAKLMRRILVDLARSRGYEKRGGKVQRVILEEAAFISRDLDFVRLDDALNALAEFDSRKAKVVELRFFGGLSVKESAEILQVSPDTVKRDWRLAKVWLLGELKEHEKDGR
ncbi:MAG: sigma-70 family RNA polymerase sigma factor [Acidobacteriota bacterium]